MDFSTTNVATHAPSGSPPFSLCASSKPNHRYIIDDKMMKFALIAAMLSSAAAFAPVQQVCTQLVYSEGNLREGEIGDLL